jgi:transportin-3
MFYEQQATTFLRALNDLAPEDLPDVIEDFFRLSTDVLLYHPNKLLASNLMEPVLSAASTSLTLLKVEPVMATLHFLRDFLAYGGDDAPSPAFDAHDGTYQLRPNPPQIKQTVHTHITTQGASLVQRCMTGMMYSFPQDCIPDASGVLLALFELVPREVALWIAQTIDLLPAGSLAAEEKDMLLRRVSGLVEKSETRKIRTLLQDFTGSYRRRNVAPREGLGGLEGGKFRFKG